MMNYSEWLSSPRIVCGLMTGTSIDGVDVALAEFSSENGKHYYKLLEYGTFEYPSELRRLALRIIHEKIYISEYAEFSYLLAKVYQSSINQLLTRVNTNFEIDAVGIHGQTLWHRGDKYQTGIYNHPVSLQAISISALAKWIQKPVVGNFREADTALGGQGAPLVPIFDYEFFTDSELNTVCLNIGGISNITILPKRADKSQVIAFDTGPGNVLIDNAMNIIYGVPFDDKGEIASTGIIFRELTDELMSIPFISKNPPKTTGRELFTIEFTKSLIEKYQGKIRKEDLIATFTNFTALSIVENIRQNSDSVDRLIASGGGIENKYLLNKIKEYLPECKISKTDEYNLPAEAKEAVCFAYLAYRTLAGLPGNLPSVTGAENETILGVVAE